jgi:formate hydrogenlyase subunit 4
MTESICHFILTLVAAPFLLSVINRTKAFFAGRRGQPWLQPYYDLFRLLRKGAVYSSTTSWVFRAGPVVGLAAVLTAATLLPFGNARSLLSFQGDFIVFVYLLGLARFVTVLAALDTGSSFEGMGANREVWFSALAEPALMLGIAVIAREIGGTTSLSLSDLHLGMSSAVWSQAGFVLALVSVAWSVVLLSENSRIPVDDPTTHLELTMIHEVMVLDHSGPDFGFILYGATLKLWLFAALFVGMILPVSTGITGLDTLIGLAGVLAVAVVIGVIESVMARLRLPTVPQLLIGSCALVALAFLIERHGVLLP